MWKVPSHVRLISSLVSVSRILPGVLLNKNPIHPGARKEIRNTGEEIEGGAMGVMAEAPPRSAAEAAAHPKILSVSAG